MHKEVSARGSVHASTARLKLSQKDPTIRGSRSYVFFLQEYGDDYQLNLLCWPRCENPCLRSVSFG